MRSVTSKNLVKQLATALILLAVSFAGLSIFDLGIASAVESDDAQVKALLKVLAGQRVALLTNPTGVDGQLNMLADIIGESPDCELVSFFAAEHGLRGDTQAGGKIKTYEDPYTGAPVYSLYGSQKAPTAEQLANVDVLVFDFQDIGVRFFTYVWSMTYAMEAAAQNGVKFIVFDRPNPIGAHRVAGAPNKHDSGLVGRVWQGHPFGVPTRHGMTPGEFAQLVNGEWLDPKVELQVIPLSSYTREQYFDETGRPWVFPSPNMPTLDTALVYPGMCLFEGTNLSEGRGTTKPFELIGAPYVNGIDFAQQLNALKLPGVRFRPAFFKPTFSDWKGELCGGIQVHVMDRDEYEPIQTALHILKTAVRLYPDELEVTSGASKLMGVDNLPERIKTESVDSIVSSWQEDLQAFKQIREKYLIYN